MASIRAEKTSRQVQAELTREKVLKAGASLIEERGYDTVAIADIVEAAGVSTGTFYHYFTSKDELYYDYICRSFSDVDASLAEHMDLPLVYNLRHYFDTWFKEISRLTPDYLAHWLGHAADVEYHQNANSVQDVGQLHADAIKECLVAYVEKGALAVEAPIEELAQYIVTVLYGVDVRYCMTNGQLDLSKQRDFLDHLVRAALNGYLQE